MYFFSKKIKILQYALLLTAVITVLTGMASQRALAAGTATISLETASTTMEVNEIGFVGVTVKTTEALSGVDQITATPSNVSTNYCDEAISNGSGNSGQTFTCSLTFLVTAQMVAAGSFTVNVKASITHAGNAPDTSISKSIKFTAPKQVTSKSCKGGAATAIQNGVKCTNENKVVCNSGYVTDGVGSQAACIKQVTSKSCKGGAATSIANGLKCTNEAKVVCNSGYIAQGSTACVKKPPQQLCPDGRTILAQGKDISSCPDPADSATDCSGGVGTCDLFKKYINPFIKFLAAFVGLAVVISIIVGGIQYGSSAGDPQKVSAAKNRIRNAIIALVTFIFLYALLNFLIPGGLGA